MKDHRERLLFLPFLKNLQYYIDSLYYTEYNIIRNKGGGAAVAFNTGAALMDALVLSTVAKEPTYGYRITQDVRKIMLVSESTLYPVLRRLQKEGCLDTYDQEFAGRNRRYYCLTPAGAQALERYRQEWVEYKKQIDSMLLERDDEE